MNYRKKPVVIQAVQWTGDNWEEVSMFGRSGEDKVSGRVLMTRASKVVVRTLEGTMNADVGDWIIKGVQGEFYPCKPAIFDATYEPV